MDYGVRTLTSATVRLTPPEGVVLASVFVDDGMPGLNPMTLHQPNWNHERAVPNAVIDAFADLSDEMDLRGKFSVVPYPLGLGRIDQGIPGVPPEVISGFLDTVRRRLAPRYDLTPELLTHGPALDPHTGYVTHLTEKEWGSTSSAPEWAAYFRMAFSMLRTVGIAASGVTMPWDTASDNEDAMARGLDAAAGVLGLPVVFYFLHAVPDPERAMPEVRVMHGPEAGMPRAVVSVKCTPEDPAWPLQYGKADKVDRLITRDGADGFMVRFAEAGAPAVVVTHWQSLFANGSSAGVACIREVARRMRARFGSRLRWTRAGDLANLAAAGAALTATEGPDGTLVLDLPVAVKEARLTVEPTRGGRFSPDAVTGADAASVTAGPGGAVRIEGALFGTLRLSPAA